jgi:hypothetical protein
VRAADAGFGDSMPGKRPPFPIRERGPLSSRRPGTQIATAPCERAITTFKQTESMKIRSILIALMLAWGAIPAVAAAQLFTPSYLAPVRSSDMGIHVSDGFGRGGGLAVEGLWRRGFGGYDLGLRGGVGEGSGEAYLLVGGDYRRPLVLGTEPVAVFATGGAQAAIGNRSSFGLDAGVTIGSTFVPEGIPITPYLHPRIALISSHRDEDESRLRLGVLADLGVEVESSPDS